MRIQAENHKKITGVAVETWRAFLGPPNGLDNLMAILNDQPYENSTLSVIQVRTIIENKGGFMPNEAVMWFREWTASS